MTALLLQLPFLFFSFWFYEAPIFLISYFSSVNKAFFNFFSLSQLAQTFFKPIKNEYREGLIGFSIVMGIFIKSVLITTTLFIFLILLILEIVSTLLFVLFPIGVVGILFL